MSQSTRIEFESIVGAENVQSSDQLKLPRSWGQRPDLIVSPSTAAEIVAVVIAAEGAITAIIPFGGGNQLGAGYPPTSDRPTMMLCTRRMNRVLDHQPDDLTITCEAGVTLEQVEQTVRQHNQMLALDGPLPGSSTVGGMVSAATAGARRIAYGTPRDALIGMRAVMTGGIDVKGGGRVVKNVAGYDVCKLFTGSWGSLGVLTELTFKVRPLPAVTRRLSWQTGDIASAIDAGFKLHLAGLAPTMVLASADLDGFSELIVGLEGSAQRVEWQTSEFARRVAADGISSPMVELTDKQYLYLNNWPAIMAGNSNAAARAACLPAELASVAGRIAAIPFVNILADCAVGTLHCSFTNADCNTVTAFRTALPTHANCVWTRLDITGDCAESTPRWGNMREERLLQASMKTAIDPLGTFSPGRFPGR